MGPKGDNGTMGENGIQGPKVMAALRYFGLI